MIHAKYTNKYAVPFRVKNLIEEACDIDYVTIIDQIMDVHLGNDYDGGDFQLAVDLYNAYDGCFFE